MAALGRWLAVDGCLFFFCVWEKAYMPIDANHISNLKWLSALLQWCGCAGL